MTLLVTTHDFDFAFTVLCSAFIIKTLLSVGPLDFVGHDYDFADKRVLLLFLKYISEEIKHICLQNQSLSMLKHFCQLDHMTCWSHHDY